MWSRGGCAGAGAAHAHRFDERPDAGYSFVFTNATGVAGVRGVLARLRAPDVVVWNTGLWLGGRAEGELRREYRRFFALADELWPRARVAVRSTTSVVQPVTCFEAGGHGRGRSMRMREWLRQETWAWRGRAVGWVDAFAMTDSRWETTLDGFHWVSERLMYNHTVRRRMRIMSHTHLRTSIASARAPRRRPSGSLETLYSHPCRAPYLSRCAAASGSFHG